MFSLSKQDTAIMKGVAICAMLFHHLYFSIPDWVKPYDGLLYWLGELGKVCVSMFLFCSGYGLSVQFTKTQGVKEKAKFMLKRFASFYVNYWMVFVWFVPLTIFAFHRPLSAAYGEHVNLVKHLAYDIMGVQGVRSYNVTWWFNKLIIILWLLFPFIYWLAKKSPLLTMLGSLIVARFWMAVVGWDCYADLYLYQLPFVLGIVWQLGEGKLNRVGDYIKGKPILFSFVSICLVAAFVYLRMKPVIPYWSGLRMDAFLSCSIVLLVLSSIKKLGFLSKGLSFLGKHSGNIYMIHTFFNVYWHLEWLHTSTIMRYGVNFVVLLGISLLASMLFELIKKRMGIYTSSRRVLDRI